MREPVAEGELERLCRVKQRQPEASAMLGPEMISFFRQSVHRRQTKFSQIADCWSRLVPPMLAEHCALESLSRGTLLVLVDSASHLYELKQLLLAGLQQQLLLACKPAGLRKIMLRPGRWYDAGGDEPRKIRFN